MIQTIDQGEEVSSSLNSTISGEGVFLPETTSLFLLIHG
jgi:hypothetical protein